MSSRMNDHSDSPKLNGRSSLWDIAQFELGYKCVCMRKREREKEREMSVNLL